MAILSLDDYIAAARQQVQFFKNQTNTNSAGFPTGVFDRTGVPGAGTLAVGDTAAGIVPTDATTGHPAISDFGAGNKGYIGAVHFSNTVAARMALFDCLFAAGAYAYNANVTLASQPSFSSRVPGGTDYSNLELWVEAVTAFGGTAQTLTITYTNQAGTTGRTTGAMNPSVTASGRMFRCPLQAGDNGLQKIESVVSSGPTSGTFNVYIMRRLWNGRVAVANASDQYDMLRSGLPEVFADSALRMVVWPDSSNTGNPEAMIEIVNG